MSDDGTPVPSICPPEDAGRLARHGFGLTDKDIKDANDPEGETYKRVFGPDGRPTADDTQKEE